MTSWMVIITSTDPETGAVERDVYEVTPTPTPGSERQVLGLLVTGIHPEAAEQSYDGWQATFLDGRRQITAAFEVDGVVAPPTPPPEQGSLFDP